MAHVQSEIEQTQELIPGGPAVAEKKEDNFLTRLNKYAAICLRMKTKFAGSFRFRIYATLKREVEKVDVAQTDEADQVTALLIDAVQLFCYESN